jgi:5'-nucleotidase
LKNYGQEWRKTTLPRFSIVALAIFGLALAGHRTGLRAQDRPSTVTVSIVATTDLHGAALPGNGLGGLALLAGFVNNLRAVRASDGGSVLLIDSGDTFQGGIVSDLSEGALVVDAYNTMGYAAEAIGNHDFDFGSVDSPSARQLRGDSRGAIKARAAQARYPFLAANLIDEATGRSVAWPNVRPSVLVDAAGVKVGIVGVMTVDALQSTIAANVRGLRVAPPGPAIAAEAATLRAAGADVVIVAAHAGGRCDRFDGPDDLASCDEASEIFRIARSLPPRQVDVIAAGHTHGALAHRVNGIAIVQSFSRGQAFGRVDVLFDPKTRSAACKLFPPVALTEPAEYEGRPVVADPRVVHAMAPALDRVRRLQETLLGVSLEAPIRRGGERGSPLGHLFADAIREAAPDADVAVLNTATRGLWADLPDGPLTFGRLYDVFPFDNRIARIRLRGAELRGWVADEIAQGRLAGLGISGASVRVSCLPKGVHVDLVTTTGRAIRDDDKLLVATIGSPTLSGSVAFVSTGGGMNAGDAPVVREAVEDWFTRRPHLASKQPGDGGSRIELTDPHAAACVARQP